MSLQSEVEKLPPEERRKIGELIRTKGDQQPQLKNANGPDASTAWMYEQPKGNAEDFLLGKAIRSLEELTEINRDQEEETPTQRLTRLDMEAKFREDPLNLMRQHEMDKRSALLQNTARMKKLQRLIELQNHAKEKAEKRKEKRKRESKRKNKRRRISSSSSSDSSENPEDDAILEKFISLIRNPDGAKDKAEDSEKGEERKKKEEKKKKHHHSQKEVILQSDKKPTSSRHLSSVRKLQDPSPEGPLASSDDRPRRGSKSMSGTKALKDRSDWNRREPRSKSPQSPRSNQHSQKTSHVGSLYCTDQRRSRSRSQQKAHECRIDDRTRRRSRSRSFGGAARQHRSLQSHSHLQGRHKRSSRSRSFEQSHRRGARRRTQEEMAVLRVQMAADAKEREAERQQRFEKHRAETAREEKVEGEARAKHGASFLRGLTLDHVASTSVEEGVQRNAKSRQRGGMNENFLKR